MTPIDTATNTAGTAIPVGGAPDQIAITPDGKTAYVDGVGARCGVMNVVTVRPIRLPAGTVGAPIPIACRGTISDIAITPNSKTAEVVAYMLTFGDQGGVTSINVTTNKATGGLTTGRAPVNIAFTPAR